MLKLVKVYNLLPIHRQRQLPLIIGLMVIGAGFEVFGISLILPLFQSISGESSGILRDTLRTVFSYLDDREFIILCVCMLGFIYVLKSLYLGFLAWFISRFAFGIRAELGTELLQRYLQAKYEFHLSSNSAQLVRNLTTEVIQFTANGLIPMLLLITEAIVIIFICIFLFVIEPIGSIITATLFVLFSTLFQKFLGAYSRNLGAKRQRADGLVIQKAQESFGGIREIKLLDRSSLFADRFKLYATLASDASAKQYVVTQIPRLYLESISILTFSVLVIYTFFEAGSLDKAMPVLGVFALAAFRLLPSANRFLFALNSLRYAEPSIVTLHEQIKAKGVQILDSDLQQIRLERLEFGACIELNNVSYRYPEEASYLLKNINLTIKAGESIGIVGKSGSGKSTLVNLITGLIHPTEGQVLVNEIDVKSDLVSWYANVGYVPQDVYLLDGTIEENITFGLSGEEVNSAKLSSVLKDAHLTEFLSTLKDGKDTFIGERGVRLSGGQKQRIGIARALYKDASLLVFDEATSALDTDTEREIVTAIDRLSVTHTVIVIAHRESTIKGCDRVLLIENGKVSNVDS